MTRENTPVVMWVQTFRHLCLFVLVWMTMAAHSEVLPEAVDASARVDWFQSAASQNRVAIVWRNERAGLMDGSGRLLTPMRYQHIERMDSNGSADLWFHASLPVDADGLQRVGVLDERGRVVIEPAWRSVEMVLGRTSVPQNAPEDRQRLKPIAFEVRQSSRVGFMSLQGQITIEPKFDAARQLRDDEPWMLLRQGDDVALCHVLTGECPVPLGAKGVQWPKRDGLVQHFLLFGAPGSWGVMSHRGETLLPAEYDELILPMMPTIQNDPTIMGRQGVQRSWWRVYGQPDGTWSLAARSDPLLEQCNSGKDAWHTERARSVYRAWLKDWLRIWQPALRRGEFPSYADGSKLVWSGSRAMSTLSGLLRDDPRMSEQIGIRSVADARHGLLLERMLDALKRSEPVGDGGLYPESDPNQAQACARVWYVRLQGVDARMSKGGHTRSPLESAYGLPPAGTLARGRFAFLTFHESERGIQLVGISKEFLQLAWWMAEEGGR